MYRIRAVDGHDEDVADILADIHRFTFFDMAAVPNFDHGHWWLAYRDSTPVGFAGVIPSTHAHNAGYFFGSGCCTTIQATSFSFGLCARWRRKLDEMVGARWYQIRQTTPFRRTTLFERVTGFIDREIRGRGHKRCIGTNRCNDRNSHLRARSLVAKNRLRDYSKPGGRLAIGLFFV